METLVLPNLLNNLCYRVCEWNEYFQLDTEDSERTEDDANKGEYDEL